MLTLKTLNKKIQEIEEKIITPVKDVEFIARTNIYTSDNDYKKEKENLIKRGFKLIKTEECNSLWYTLWEKVGMRETWEKKYAEGEF